MISRDIYSTDHNAYLEAFSRFCEREIEPHHDHWLRVGHTDPTVWRKAGEAGHLCMGIPSTYGGGGGDALFTVVQMEELTRRGLTAVGFSLHSEIVAPYILDFGTEEQRQRLLPPMARGERIGAIAMTEPDSGSNLRDMRTTAVRQSDGAYLLSGSKIFITNGWLADIFLVAAQTTSAGGERRISLFIVEGGMDGFSRGKPLEKLGLRGLDTVELFFDQVRIPSENVLGGIECIGKGLSQLMAKLPWERLQIGVMAIAAAEASLERAVVHVNERKVFGKHLGSFQVTRHKLAEIQAEIAVGRVFVDRCLEMLMNGKLDAQTAAICKYWASELQFRVADTCLQLFGGYGYMWDFPVAKEFVDARVQRIYGGSNEVMKELIARDLNLAEG